MTRKSRLAASLAAPLMIGLAAVAATDPAAAEQAGALVAANPANRSGQPEVSRRIAAMIAERSASAAVKARAATAPEWGRLEVGTDEILAEIGAASALGVRSSTPAPATQAAAPAARSAPAAVRAVPPVVEPFPETNPFSRRESPFGPRHRGGYGGGSGGGGGHGGW